MNPKVCCDRFDDTPDITKTFSMVSNKMGNQYDEWTWTNMVHSQVFF